MDYETECISKAHNLYSVYAQWVQTRAQKSSSTYITSVGKRGTYR